MKISSNFCGYVFTKRWVEPYYVSLPLFPCLWIIIIIVVVIIITIIIIITIFIVVIIIVIIITIIIVIIIIIIIIIVNIFIFIIFISYYNRLCDCTLLALMLFHHMIIWISVIQQITVNVL